MRGRSNGVAWELWLRAPPPELLGLLAGTWAADADSSHARHRMLPNGELWLTFNLGPPQHILDLDGTVPGQVCRAAFVCGLQDRPFAVESLLRHPRVVTVRLLPRGAWAFFAGLPLRDLANRVFDLESVLGGAAGVERLRQRLAEAPHLGAALDLVEGWLTARLRAGPPAHALTRTALGRLWKGRGTARVDSLARDLGVSSRHLHALFQHQVGLSPKGLCRVLRFEGALDTLDGCPAPDLVHLAQQCGYYDQSHLNRDFRELAGLTPTEYRARVFRLPGWREIGG
jgi:AraC-like DNA-binding protein